MEEKAAKKVQSGHLHCLFCPRQKQPDKDSPPYRWGATRCKQDTSAVPCPPWRAQKQETQVCQPPAPLANCCHHNSLTGESQSYCFSLQEPLLFAVLLQYKPARVQNPHNKTQLRSAKVWFLNRNKHNYWDSINNPCKVVKLHQALGGLTALAPLGDGSAFVVGYPVHCRVFCRIAGHHPLYPSGTPP